MSVLSACTLAVLLLVGTGLTYRVFASYLGTVLSAPVVLPLSLAEFPMKIAGWTGHEMAIPATTKAYLERNFADDFVSRRYINPQMGIWADIYIVYCSSKPAGILGHKPSVCYPAHGWIHDSTELSTLQSETNRTIPCLLHRFHKPAPANEQVIVLSFYVLNGRPTANESDFSGLLGRRPNIAGDPARYVAQIQISSVLENAIRAAAGDMIDTMLDFLPDTDGFVKAVDYIKPESGTEDKPTAGQ
jgi:hypothetical protein